MGQITAGIGLVSGLPINDIIDQLIEIEARPRDAVEERNAVIRAQQTAFQDINAQLLNLKLGAANVANRTTFNAKSAISGNEEVLTATAGTEAVPGNYSFRINNLVSSQQTVTRGFGDTDRTFVGAGSITFESAKARLDSDTRLENLNGGDGVRRGTIRITDRTGNSAGVDLSTAVTVDDVVNAINSTLDVNVIASVTGDGLTVTDNTGLTTGNLRVSELGAGSTAASLGLDQISATGVITGTNINALGVNTKLATINDGNGVRRSAALDDLRIATAGGGTFDINLGDAVTLGDVIDAIDTATGSTVLAAVGDDGVSLKLTDTTGGGTAFAVTALNGSGAAADLGILGSDDDNDGDIAGERVISEINSKLIKYLNGGAGLTEVGGTLPPVLDPTTPLADLFDGAGLTTAPGFDLEVRDRNGLSTFVDVDTLTTAGDLIGAVGGGLANVTLSIEGNAFRLTDNSGGAGNLRVIEPTGSVATELGLLINSPVSTVLGNDTNPRALPNGAFGPGQLDIQNRAGTVTTVDLIDARSVSDVLDTINASGAGVTAELNTAGNGLLLTDTSGGTGDLIVSDVTGNAATGLGLTGTYTEGVADSGNLQFQYITEGTSVDGLGVNRGRFIIRDSAGASATVDITQGNEETLKDVIDEINSRGLSINARINDNGDGILIEDLGPGTQAIEIEEDGSSTAADLGLLGRADSPGADFNGSLERTLTVSDIQTIDGTTLLSDLNNGEGVGFNATQDDLRFTTKDGSTFDVDLAGATTVDDVITAISTATGGSVTVSVNGQGTGLRLTDNTIGNAEFRAESINDSDAGSDLGFLGVDDNGDGVLNGDPLVELTTLSDLVTRINDGAYGVSAAIVNDGTPGAPFRLSLSANQTGSGGAFITDSQGIELGAVTVNEANDAVVFVGGGDPANALLITSESNTLEDVIPGATIDLLTTSDQPVQVTINEDDDAIAADVRGFVEAFNVVAERLDQYDSYNAETEERGLLLGDSAVLSVRRELFNSVISRNNNLSGQFKSLSEVGITVGSGSRLQLNETKLRDALLADRDAVQALFTLRETTTDSTGEETTTSVGIGARIDDLLERLTDSQFGPIQSRVDSLDRQIQLNEDRLEALDQRLEASRARLEAQFTAMERALADLQGQGNSLGALQQAALSASQLGG